MSYRVTSLVRSKTTGHSNKKSILLVMADVANHDGSDIWISKPRMAAETELSISTVRRVIKDLLKTEIIVEGGKKRCGNGYTVIYHMSLSKIQTLPDSIGYDETSPEIDEKTTPITVTGVNSDDDGCQADTPHLSGGQVSPSTQTGDTYPPDTQTVLEQSLNDPKQPNPPPLIEIDPKLGSFHYMTPGEKHPIPEKFYPGQDIKDYALIDLRIYPQEYRDIIVNFAEYWRDKSRTTRGKKTPRGWKAALRTWLNKEAVSLKAKWRDQPFDYRDKEKGGAAAVPDDVSEYPPEYWELHVRRYSDQGDWSAVGPNPDEPECLAPDEILKKYDFAVKDESQG